MDGRNCWLELIGMHLYLCDEIYFYAWGGENAIKKKKEKGLEGNLFIINDYGEKIAGGLNN